MREYAGKFLGEIVSGLNFIRQRKRDNTKLAGREHQDSAGVKLASCSAARMVDELPNPKLRASSCDRFPPGAAASSCRSSGVSISSPIPGSGSTTIIEFVAAAAARWGTKLS